MTVAILVLVIFVLLGVGSLLVGVGLVLDHLSTFGEAVVGLRDQLRQLSGEQAQALGALTDAVRDEAEQVRNVLDSASQDSIEQSDLDAARASVDRTLALTDAVAEIQNDPTTDVPPPGESPPIDDVPEAGTGGVVTEPGNTGSTGTPGPTGDTGVDPGAPTQ